MRFRDRYLGALCALLVFRSVLLGADASAVCSVSIGGLENAYQYSEQVYGGSGPYSADDFAALRQMGIGFVISVDGATPKVTLAEAEGLRYVHIPIGYDGVPDDAQLQLVKAHAEASGLIYVHCHHGKHRGPAAIASMLVGAGELSVDEAIAALRLVGTSDAYQGLYRDVKNAQVVSSADLAGAEPLVSVAVVSDFAQSMAAIDVHWDNLKLIQKADWQVTAEHPDIDPPHEALMLNEHIRELLRQEAGNVYSEEELTEMQDFKEYLSDSVKQSAELESGLREGRSVEQLEHTFQALRQSCKSCHKAYRN